MKNPGIFILRKGESFSFSTRTWAERHTEREIGPKKEWGPHYKARHTVIMPHLKYPPGIITALKGSKDRAQTTLI